jgi:uncharacterized membrane protein
MIGVGAVYALVGVLFAAIAAFSAADDTNPRRWGNAAFWGLFAASFLAGDRLGDFANGLLVLALALIGGLGLLGRGRTPEDADADADFAADAGAGTVAPPLGARLFLPVLIIPAVTLAGTLTLGTIRLGGRPLADPKQVTVIALAGGVILALAAAAVLLRPTLAAPVQAARRLMDQVGWAAILPQLLAALGAVFALAGVGHAVGGLIGAGAPLGDRTTAVVAYGLGMTLFTMIMGNAFAALPVMVAAIGAPVLVGRFGGDAAVVGSLGMLCGYCGTLMTPMAAHNIVPTALLDLPQGAVIRAQAPTAILVLLANLVLMNVLAFRH